MLLLKSPLPVGKTTKQLWFDYPSTARIRILKSNCYENPEYPCIYRIITDKLDFTLPRSAVIFNAKHAYIPLQLYRKELDLYYAGVRLAH